jgi:GntR family transcriptional regulator / MocR family aminotransferase
MRTLQPSTITLPHLWLNTASSTALHQQLTQALREAMEQGMLKPGSRLPASRDAAAQLGLGRNTVVDAYAQLLADGLLETHGRHGTFVAALAKVQPSRRKAPLQVTQGLTHVTSAAQPVADWCLGQACVQLMPLQTWRSACKEAGRHLPPSGYGDPRGEPALRQSIADWLRLQRGVNYEADQIVVTQGAGAAIGMLASVLIKPGDICAVEQPGYSRAVQAFQSMGAQLRSLAVDHKGADIAAAFVGIAPAVLHLTPAHQYPMGGRLSGYRRAQLAQRVREHHSLVIENEYDHEFIHEGQNHAPLAARLPEHTVLVSTFAKAISPSLRLGFVAAPPEIAQALAGYIESKRLHVSWPVQASVQWLLQSGELQKHLRRVRRYYAQLRSRLLSQLRLQCPDLHISGYEGGLHLVLRCASPTKTARMIAQLKKHGIALQTARDFGGDEEALLLAYGHMDDLSLAQSLLYLQAFK